MDFKKGNDKFYLGEDENNAATKIEYKVDGDVLTVEHTHVDEADQGKGVAGKLVEKVVEYARENDLKLDATCFYAKKKFQEDDELKDIYVGE